MHSSAGAWISCTINCSTGGPFRVLTVVNQWSRQSPVQARGFSLTGSLVAALERVRITHWLPVSITVDHETEFMSKALEPWAFHRGLKLDLTRSGKPTDNRHTETFDGRLRYECLNALHFPSLAHATQLLNAWRTDYNQHRPHSLLGHLTPNEFAISSQVHAPEKPATFQF